MAIPSVASLPDTGTPVMDAVDAPPERVRLNSVEGLVLRELADWYSDDACCRYFDSIALETGLARAEVRRAARSLARKGLAAYERGLFDDGGRVAGSGYRCTLVGRSHVRSEATITDGDAVPRSASEAKGQQP